METQSPSSRRDFLNKIFQSCFLFLVGGKLTMFSQVQTSFTTEYAIDISSIPNAVKLNEEQIIGEIVNRIISMDILTQNWFDGEENAKRRYRERGLLVQSKTIISEDGSHLRFVTSWKDLPSFYSYFAETDFEQLHRAFALAGLHPKLINGDNVITKDAILNLQSSVKLS